MAKRGSTRPWRVEFRWAHPVDDPTGPAIHGTDACGSLEGAEHLVRELQARSDVTGVALLTVVQHRDFSESRVQTVYVGQPEES